MRFPIVVPTIALSGIESGVRATDVGASLTFVTAIWRIWRVESPELSVASNRTLRSRLASKSKLAVENRSRPISWKLLLSSPPGPLTIAIVTESPLSTSVDETVPIKVPAGRFSRIRLLEMVIAAGGSFTSVTLMTNARSTKNPPRSVTRMRIL